MHKGRIRVLIAEDNRDFTTLLSSCFSLYPDIEIAGVARDGAEALRQIEGLNPDVLLLDIVMPVMDGMEVLERLHASGERRPAVFVLSAISSEQIVQRAIELGAVYYFVKPCNTEVMIEKIRSVMAGSQKPAI